MEMARNVLQEVFAEVARKEVAA